MSRKTGWLALGLLLALGACAPQPYIPAQYTEPTPLQPYAATPVVTNTWATTRRHVVRRHYARRRHRVHCRCVPAQ